MPVFSDHILPEIAARRESFIASVDEAIGKSYRKTDALTAFAMHGLRSVENGCSEFQSALWQRAIVAVAASPPLAWQAILAAIDAGHLEQSHITLLRIIADPAGVHERFSIAMPANCPLPMVILRAMNATHNMPIESRELFRLWDALVVLGLAWKPSDMTQNIASLNHFATDLGNDFVRLLCGHELPIQPKAKPAPAKPKRILTPLAWLAAAEPETYEFVSATP